MVSLEGTSFALLTNINATKIKNRGKLDVLDAAEVCAKRITTY